MLVHWPNEGLQEDPRRWIPLCCSHLRGNAWTVKHLSADKSGDDHNTRGGKRHTRDLRGAMKEAGSLLLGRLATGCRDEERPSQCKEESTVADLTPFSFQF